MTCCTWDRETIKYIIKKNGWKETKKPGNGMLYWFSSSLRDIDIAILKTRPAYYNRYPRIKVSAKSFNF
jgi:hypothetical protein